MKSITQKLQDDIRKILEANLHPNQQKIDVHEPEKDEITAHDFKKLRDMKKGKSKDDMQKDEAVHGMKKKHTMQELSGKAAQQAAVAISLIKAGKKDGKMPKPQNEELEVEEYINETIILHDSFTVDIKDVYSYGEYLTVAKELVGEENAIELANYAFKNTDKSIFIEQFMRSDIEDRVASHQKAGHKVSTPKYSTKSGKPHAEYVVTDKESGVRRKYIHHGNARSVENMGAAGKRDE